jgi:hypothetical protein
MSEKVDRLFRRMKGNKADEIDFLQTPLREIKKPILIESGHLKDRLYLCANEAQAQEIEQAGGVCYLPEEVSTLLKNSEGMDDESLRDYLNKIHATKKTFLGARICHSKA